MPSVAHLRPGAPPSDALAGVRTALVVFVSLVMAACMAIAVVTAFLRGIDEGVLIATGAAGLFVVLVPLAMNRRFSLVEPIVYVLFIVLIGFTLKTVYVVWADTPKAEYLIRFGRAPSFFLYGALWTLVGLISFTFGYVSTTGRVALERLRPFQSDEWHPQRVWVATGIMATIGIAAALLYVQLMGVNFTDLNALSSKRYYEIEGAETSYGSLGYVVWASRFAEYAAYILYTYLAFRNERLWSMKGLLLGSLVVVAIVVPFVANSRQSAVLVPINLLMLSLLLRQRLNKRVALSVLMVVIMGLITLTALRQNRSDTISDSLMSSAAMEEIVGSRHFNDFTRTSHILAAVPEYIEYKYGVTFVGWIVAPIPRVLWKGKPFLGIGKEVAEKAFGYTDRRGVPPGFLAEIAVNFTVWAIPLFMFLAGAMLKVFYLSFVPILHSKKGALLYVMVAYPAIFTLLNNEVTVMVTRVLIAAVPFLVLFLFLQPRRSRSRARRHSVSLALR